MTKFTDLGLTETLLPALAAEGYIIPTPIQHQAIPPLRAGHDVLGIAQTGTGKTAAFVLPLLDRLARDRHAPRAKQCRALILAPTRELAGQIADNITRYGRDLRPRTALVVGGVKPGPQIKALASGVEILVATPGRLEDHLATGAVRLDKTDVIVLDEADQMLDLGFLPAIRRLMTRLPGDRQTVLFSATMPKPIRALARDFQQNPQEIAVTPAARPIERIEQRAIAVTAGAKPGLLMDLLAAEDVTRAVVFTRTKRGADKLCRTLDQAGLNAAAIHGNKSQAQRTKTLTAFRAGHTPILVATDIAARGIDIDDVTHVINYELPTVPEAYVHRIGRTARAGKTGTAIAFCDADERGLLRDIERLIGRTLLDDGMGVGGSVQSAVRTKPPVKSPLHRQKRPRRHGRPANGPAITNRCTDGDSGGLTRMLGA